MNRDVAKHYIALAQRDMKLHLISNTRTSSTQIRRKWKGMQKSPCFFFFFRWQKADVTRCLLDTQIEARLFVWMKSYRPCSAKVVRTVRTHFVFILKKKFSLKACSQLCGFGFYSILSLHTNALHCYQHACSICYAHAHACAVGESSKESNQVHRSRVLHGTHMNATITILHRQLRV